MRKNHSKRGVIPIAFVFVIALSLILAASTGLYYNKVALSVSRLKRYQAINYTKTALREAARRFWGDYTDAGSVTWDAKAWADYEDSGGTAGSRPADADRNVTIEGVTVDIDVAYQGAVPAAGAVGPWQRKTDFSTDYTIKVSATVRYSDINL